MRPLVVLAIVLSSLPLATGPASAGTPYEIHLTVDPSYPEDVRVTVTDLTTGSDERAIVYAGTDVWGDFDWVAEWTDDGGCTTMCTHSAAFNLEANTPYEIEIDPFLGAAKTYTFNGCPTYESDNQLGIKCPHFVWTAPHWVNDGDIYIDVLADGTVRTFGDGHRAVGYFEDLQPDGKWVIPHDFRGSSGKTYGYFLHLGPDGGNAQTYSVYWGWPGCRIQVASTWYEMGGYYVTSQPGLHAEAARFCDEKSSRRPASLTSRILNGGSFVVWTGTSWSLRSSFPMTQIDNVTCFWPDP